MKQARREREERVGKMQLEREKERQVHELLFVPSRYLHFINGVKLPSLTL